MSGKKLRIFSGAFILLVIMAGWAVGDAGGQGTKAAAPAPASPDPLKIIQDMTTFLQSQGQLSFRAETTDDQVYLGGKKLQYSLDLEIALRRPDKLRVNGQGDLQNQEFFYDGMTMTLYHQDQNVYAIAPMPPTIDAAMAKAHQDFGLQVALADLLCSNAYELMTRHITHALYVGRHMIRGVPCHHLAFDQDNMQWQIWIEAGEKPLPRKLLITQKKLLGSPQWTAYLTDWNLTPQLADSRFTFTPPSGSHQIEFLPPAKIAKAKPKPKTKSKSRSKKQGEQP